MYREDRVIKPSKKLYMIGIGILVIGTIIGMAFMVSTIVNSVSEAYLTV